VLNLWAALFGAVKFYAGIVTLRVVERIGQAPTRALNQRR